MSPCIQNRPHSGLVQAVVMDGAGAHFVADGIWDCPVIIERINRRLRNRENPLPQTIEHLVPD